MFFNSSGTAGEQVGARRSPSRPPAERAPSPPGSSSACRWRRPGCPERAPPAPAPPAPSGSPCGTHGGLYPAEDQLKHHDFTPAAPSSSLSDLELRFVSLFSVTAQHFNPLKQDSDLFQSFGPRLLGSDEAHLGVLRLLKASKQLLVEGVLLPGPDPVTVLRHQRATDGGVEGGQPVGRGQEALPGLEERAVQRTCGTESER